MQWDFGGFPWWLTSSQVCTQAAFRQSSELLQPSCTGKASPCAAAHSGNTCVQVVGGGGDKATQMRIRSDDPKYLMHVDRWWNALLPRLAHLTYQRGARPPCLDLLAARCWSPCAAFPHA